MSLVIYLILWVLQATATHSITNVTTFNKIKTKRNTGEEVCLNEAAETGDNFAPPVFLTGMVTLFSELCATLRKGFRHSSRRKIKQEEGNSSTDFCTRPWPQDFTRRDWYRNQPAATLSTQPQAVYTHFTRTDWYRNQPAAILSTQPQAVYTQFTRRDWYRNQPAVTLSTQPQAVCTHFTRRDWYRNQPAVTLRTQPQAVFLNFWKL